MSFFNYKARNSSGQLKEGQIEALNENAVADDLVKRSLTPISIEAVEQASEGLGGLSGDLAEHFNQPGRAELILFSRQMHALTKAGVPIITGLKRIAESTAHPKMRAIIEDITDELESGRELAVAMSAYPKVFSTLYIGMIRIGEQSGRLDESFYRMFEFLERDEATLKNIKSAIRYPSFVLVAIAVAVAIIMTFVIPQFASIYESFNLELPLPTRIIIATANFFAEYWVFVFSGILAAIFGFRHYINTPDGRFWWDKTKLKFPVIGSIILRGTLARFAGAFAMTYRSGMQILEGMKIVSQAVDNAYIQDKIQDMREGIARGENLSNVTIQARVFTPLVVQMIVIGEETGNLEDMLQEVTEYYEREVDYDVKRLSSLIEPLLTVAIGGLVLVLALGVFLPMWDLVQAAQQ
jgi:MSHA biogenesis protein MshG